MRVQAIAAAAVLGTLLWLTQAGFSAEPNIDAPARIHIWLSHDRQRYQAIILVYDGGWLRTTERGRVESY